MSPQSAIALVAFVLGSASLPSGAAAQPRRAPSAEELPPRTSAGIPARPFGATPADRAKSGYIEGASPDNPEGSSNPQVPNVN